MTKHQKLHAPNKHYKRHPNKETTMSTNTTAVRPGTPQLIRNGLDNMLISLNHVFFYAIFPCVSLLGIVGSVTGIVVLTRRGFRKCSNVLLVSLAVSDVLFLIGRNNFVLYVFMDNPKGFTSSEIINYIFYIVNMVFMCATSIGQFSLTQIPVLITGERIIAILCPLKVYSILTPQRAIIVVACLYLLNGVFFVYMFIICMQFYQKFIDGNFAPRFEYTNIYKDHVRSGLYDFVATLANHMTGVVPLSLVTVGCIFIGIQITVVTNKRKMMTLRSLTMKPKQGISKTTKTLLSICILYVACNGFGFAIVHVQSLENPSYYTYLKIFLENIRDLLTCFNVIGDFVIYLRATKSFRRSCNIRCVLSVINC